MPTSSTAHAPKAAVTEFWNTEPCGSRYARDGDFSEHTRERYRLEPYIAEFAGFESVQGKKVLEIGVGMGADYEQWLTAGALATGVDLSGESLSLARSRCEKAGLRHDLRLADAEQLPFASNTFDIVYSYGVMHHSANPARCVREAWRVLKPGGTAKIMLYHHPSITGFFLWLRFGMRRLQTIRNCVYETLESPGTSSFTVDEVYAMFSDFEPVTIRQVFSPGDLLLNRPSAKFQSFFYRAVWKFFPRSLIRHLGKPWGLFLLITAVKPCTSGQLQMCTRD